MAEIGTTTKEQAKEALKKEIEEAAKDGGKVQESGDEGGKKDENAAHEEEQQKEVKATPSDVEEIALDWGWRPKEEFEADSENKGKQWVDPKTFVKNQKGISDAYRKRDKELQKQVDETAKTVRAMHERQEAADRRVKEAEKNARENLLKELEGNLAAAAGEGDKVAVLDINKKIVALTGELKAEEVEESGEGQESTSEGPATGANSPTVQRWLGKNDSWYGDLKNPLYAAMTLFADTRSTELGKEHTDWTWEQILAEVDKGVTEYRTNAEKQFAPPKQQREFSAVGGGTPGGSKKKTFNDLSDDEKQKCKAFVVRGAFKDNQAYVDLLYQQES